MLNKKPQRNSSVELLKILAMMMILFAHQIEEYSSVAELCVGFTLMQPTANPQFLLLNFISPLGLLGDVVFIAASAYFLLDSNKISIKKIFFLIVTEVFVMCCELIVKASIGDAISTRQIINAIFPTVLQINWFIGYYIVFYLLHPFFNYVIRKLDKKGLAIVAAILFVQCNVILFGMGNTPGSMGAKFLCFVSIYFVVAYYRYYGGKLWESQKFNIIMLILSILLYIVERIAINYIGLKLDYVAERQYGYAHIQNPFSLAIALFAINLAVHKPTYNRAVNYFSGLSLVFYLVHKHLQFQTHSHYFENFISKYGNEWLLLAYFTATLIVLGITVVLSVLFRHTVYYGVMALGDVVEKATLKLADKIKVKWNANHKHACLEVREEHQESEKTEIAEENENTVASEREETTKK